MKATIIWFLWKAIELFIGISIDRLYRMEFISTVSLLNSFYPCLIRDIGDIRSYTCLYFISSLRFFVFFNRYVFWPLSALLVAQLKTHSFRPVHWSLIFFSFFEMYSQQSNIIVCNHFFVYWDIPKTGPIPKLYLTTIIFTSGNWSYSWFPGC